MACTLYSFLSSSEDLKAFTPHSVINPQLPTAVMVSYFVATAALGHTDSSEAAEHYTEPSDHQQQG